jgi:hypothetical protein
MHAVNDAHRALLHKNGGCQIYDLGKCSHMVVTLARQSRRNTYS